MFKILSLKSAYDLFIVEKESTCLAKTLSNYKYNLSYFIEFLEEHKKLSADEIDVNSITKDDINYYVVYLRTKPKYGNHPFKSDSDKIGHIKKRSVRTYSIDMRTFINYLYDNDYLENDILKNFKLIKSEIVIKLPLSQSEVDAIDKCFNDKTFVGLRNKIIFHLMLDCGFRISDVLNLEIDNLDFDRNLIHVCNGKGSKDRLLPFPSNLRLLIKKYLLLYKKYSFDCNNLLVTTGSSPKPLTYNSLKMAFTRLKEKTGIKRLHPHLCRHTFATCFILCGGDLSSLQILMGHSSIETTTAYLHLAEQYRLCTDNYYKLDSIYFRRLM